MSAQPVIPSDELLPLAENEGPSPAQLTLMPSVNALEKFQPFSAVLDARKAEAMALVISRDDPPEEQKKKAAIAFRLRLDVFAATRLATEKIHKELKAPVLEIGTKLDDARAKIRDACEAVENHLKAQEKFAKNEVIRIENETRTARAAELQPFLDGPLAVDLGKITPEQWVKLLADSKDLHALRVERQHQAAEAAAAQAKAEAEERERIRLENERLKAEAAAREAAEQAERERAAAELQAEREAAAKAAAEAQAKLDEERAAAVKREADAARQARRMREEAEAAAKAERERIEADAAAERLTLQRAADAAKAAADKLAREAADKAAAEAKKAKDEAAAAKKAAAAPDVEKLKALAEQVWDTSLPHLADKEAARRLSEARDTWGEAIEQIAADLRA